MNLVDILQPPVSWLFDPARGKVYIEGMPRNRVPKALSAGYKRREYELADEKEPYRTCRRCKETFEIAMFPKSNSSRGGRHTICRHCRNADARARDIERRRQRNG
jgi:hypothetical protein